MFGQVQVSRSHVRIRPRRGSGFWSHKQRSHYCVPIAMPEEAEAVTRSANPKRGNGQAWQCSTKKRNEFDSRRSLNSHLSSINLWLLAVVAVVSECRKIRSGGFALPRFQ